MTWRYDVFAYPFLVSDTRPWSAQPITLSIDPVIIDGRTGDLALFVDRLYTPPVTEAILWMRETDAAGGRLVIRAYCHSEEARSDFMAILRSIRFTCGPSHISGAPQ